jgi:hypothetical protein
MVTEVELPGGIVPFDGVKMTPGIAVFANQSKSLRAPLAGATVAVQVQPPPESLAWQFESVENLSGLTLRYGGSILQCHCTTAILLGPTKLNELSVQLLPLSGIKIVTFPLSFGANVPLGGLNVTPDNPVTANQLRLPCECGAGASVTLQFQPRSSFLLQSESA